MTEQAITRITSRSFFDRKALASVLEAHEIQFESMYDMERFDVDQPYGADFYLFKDNGADILFVAHLDTVGPHEERTAHFADTAGGTVLYSRALDDRLGAYVGLELLPKMGMKFDYLLTTGEEDGLSTAAFFDASDHHDRQYNWIIEFDRGGTDVVMYSYEDETLVDMVEATGADVGNGILSDISYMEHVGVKAFNWGVGYRDYHGPRAHVWLSDMFEMIDYFADFHETWADVHLPHVPVREDWYGAWKRARVNNADDEGVCAETTIWGDDCEGQVIETENGWLCPVHAEWYKD